MAYPVSPRGDKRYLWYKAEKTWREMTEAERKNSLVTEIDVLFGSDQPWYGFEKVDQAVYDGMRNIEPVWLTYRKGIKREYMLLRTPSSADLVNSQRRPAHPLCTSRATADSRSCRSRIYTTLSASDRAETLSYLLAPRPTTSPIPSWDMFSTLRSLTWSSSLVTS